MRSERFDGVSVVIPTFNRPTLLPLTIASVLAQTKAAREIIVVNNGEVGDLPALIESFGDRVKLIQQAPGGVQRARNAGIAAAQSSWIATVDDDDLCQPDWLETMAPALADGRADIVFCDHRKFSLKKGAFPKTNFESAPIGYWADIPTPAPGDEWSFVDKFPIRRLLSFIGFYPSTMTIRRDLFEKIGGYDPRVWGIPTEDIEFLIRALHAGHLAITWRPLVDYRVHDSNTAGNYDKQRVGRWRLFEFVAENGPRLPEDFHRALAQNLLGRRQDIFDFAFHKGRFDVMADVAGRLAPADWSVRRRLYRQLAALPSPFNAHAARIIALPVRIQTALRRRLGPPKTVVAP